MNCPGFPASWLNAWLAAVGATVLNPALRLHWTRGGTPQAVLCAQYEDPVKILADSWPSRATLEDMPIRRRWPNTMDLPRNVPVNAFAARVAAVRSHPLSWTVSSTITDLHVDDKGYVAHAPFDPPVPRGYVMHDRLLRLHARPGILHARPGIEDLRRALDGTGERIENNGLGFDIARLGAGADGASKWVDPVVEVLAFFGMALLPVRGTGTDARLGRGVRTSTIQRGWVQGDDHQSPPRFTWPVWDSPLDCAAIDALLDLWGADKRDEWPLLGIHGAWRSVSYAPKGNEMTRGFGAERID